MSLLPLQDFFSFFYENVAWASRERPRIYLVTPYLGLCSLRSLRHPRSEFKRLKRNVHVTEKPFLTGTFKISFCIAAIINRHIGKTFETSSFRAAYVEAVRDALRDGVNERGVLPDEVSYKPVTHPVTVLFPSSTFESRGINKKRF